MSRTTPRTFPVSTRLTASSTISRRRSTWLAKSSPAVRSTRTAIQSRASRSKHTGWTTARSPATRQPTSAASTASFCRRPPPDTTSSQRRRAMWAMPTPGVSPSPAMKRSATAGATIFRWDCRRCASATDFSAASAMPSNLRSARASRLSRCCVPALLRETSPSPQTFQSSRQTPRRDSRPSSAAPIPPRSRLRMAPASRFPIS